MAEYVIGLDLGGSSVKWLAASRAGEALAQGNVAFDAKRPMHWAEEIRAVVKNISAERRETLKGIGISAPGLAARDDCIYAGTPGGIGESGLAGFSWDRFFGSGFE
jgi:predicted NBD/HSP70 family sugar kinase